MAEFWASAYGFALILLLQGLAIIAFVMGSLIFMVYADRKIWAAVQMRRGPNVVGPWGLLQTFADALKYILKEIVVPAGADKFIFFLAPFLSMMLALFAAPLVFFHQLPAWEALKLSLRGCWRNVWPLSWWGLIALLLLLLGTLMLLVGLLVIVPVLSYSLYMAYRDIFLHDGE